MFKIYSFLIAIFYIKTNVIVNVTNVVKITQINQNLFFFFLMVYFIMQTFVKFHSFMRIFSRDLQFGYALYYFLLGVSKL